MDATSKYLNGPVVITGGTGFVGMNLCLHFLEKGLDVIAVEGPSQQRWRVSNKSKLRLKQIDLTEREAVRRFVREEKPAALINCAAYGAYSSQTESERIFRVNFEAVRYLLEDLSESKNFRAFVQAGSSSEYGMNCSAPKETDSTAPDSEYAVSKVGATALVQYWGKKKQLPAWALRLYSVYGPFEEVSRLVPTLLLNAKDGKFPPLVNPRISRDFVFTADVGEAVEKVILNAGSIAKGEVYNIGTGVRTRLEDLVSIVREVFEVKAEPNWGSMPDRHWDHADWYANPNKAKKELGWQAETSLADGLRATMRWIRDEPEMINLARQHSVLARDVK